MSLNYSDLINTNFPNSLDNYILFTDVTSATKPLVQQYYAYIDAGNFTEAAQLLASHAELSSCIINSKTMQTIYDALIAIERTYSSDIQSTIGQVVKYKGEYSATTNYNMFNLTLYNGKGYMCIVENSLGVSPLTTSNWVLTTTVGASGVGLSFHTSWSASQEYTPQDCVPYGNKLYACIQTNTNKIPSQSPDFWTSIVSVPKQIIFSNTQPENQETGEIWCQTNDNDNNAKFFVKQSDGTYVQKYLETNVDLSGYTTNEMLETEIQTHNASSSAHADIRTALLSSLPWQKIATFATAGAFTWTAPDLNNGQPYEIGVFIIGGGGSGAAIRYVTTTSNYYYGGCTGGAAGFTESCILTVIPESTYNGVVGNGGLAVSIGGTSNNYYSGNAGGTSSFSGKSALGGSGGNVSLGADRAVSGSYGGQSSDGLVTRGAFSIATAPSNGDVAASPNTNATTMSFSLRSSPKMAINPFDTQMKLLAAGGGATGDGYSHTSYAQAEAYVTGGRSGYGVAQTSNTVSVTGGSATGYGNGGGGALLLYYADTNPSVTVTSGAGSPGAVLIYARKAAS